VREARFSVEEILAGDGNTAHQRDLLGVPRSFCGCEKH
jgi:hypothetical protein